MKAKKVLSTILFLLVVGFSQAQLKQGDTSSVYRSLIPEEKQEVLKNIDVIANMQMGFRADFRDAELVEALFRIEQFRLEIRGYVHKKVYFRFRHRYTSGFEPQSIDKIIKGVDLAFLRFDLSDRVQFSFGKIWADWGGIEFDMNPIDIYEYSDIIEQADNFLTGVGVYYKVTDNHGLTFQILNSRTSTFEEIYQGLPGLEASKIPLAGVVNWRGSFADGKFTTLWSYSLFSEAKNTFKNYIALGNQLKLNKITIAYDFKWSLEDLDRTGLISGDIPDDLYPYALENTLYYSNWLKFDYRFFKKWQFSFVGFIDQSKWLDDIDPLKTSDKWRTSYGYIPTIEYFPWKTLNLKFYVGYVGRIYNYSDYAKSRIGIENYNTGRFIIGLITPLLIL
jgi:hypothetical protein